MTLQEALRAFLSVPRAPETTRTYEKFLSKFVADIGPARPIELIAPADLDAYVRTMLALRAKFAEHPRRRTISEPYSPATIYRNVKMIKTFFNWLQKRDIIRESPARYLENPRPSTPLGRGKAATDDEADLLVAAARFHPRNYAIIMLLVHSGCRAGEVAALKLRDLYLADNCADVVGKGSERRTIYFNDDTSGALRDWLDVRPPCPHPYVFCSKRDGSPLQSAAVSQLVRRLSARAGIRSLGPHSLRHRVGLTFARNQIAPRVAQHYLGHRNLTITLNYYQDVDESDLRDAGKLL